MNKKLIALLVFVITACALIAKENVGGKPPVQKGPGSNPQLLYMKGSGCLPATAQRELSVNNVRTTILNGGDMWWNLSSARYEIPKIVLPGQVSKHSLFAGALWIGGISNGNLRIAAQTYRQNGNDYYPGPLSIGTASISADRCKTFDKIYSVNLTDIDNFRNNPSNWGNPIDDIANWPCLGDPNNGETRYLSPFMDVNGDGKYEPALGDYPCFNQNVPTNIPDQLMFWVYNDKGNIHAETQGTPIGLEFQTQGFAFSTNDEVNNMTFYRTKISNRSLESLDSCIFGQWVDPDLGYPYDDYVECDVQRNLGICYNGEDFDPTVMGYGLNPPSIGVNFFHGPKRPDGSEIGLTKFVYYSNDWSAQGNPQNTYHYWGYLNGRWKDGSNIMYGGDGTGKGGGATHDTASFMFPGSTDPAGRPLWTEVTAGNTPGDRRFLQTAGSFSLLPGAVNEVTIGVVWARTTSGGARGSFDLLKQASDHAKSLYVNNFVVPQGPKAPTVEIVEMNKQLLFTFSNTSTIENFTDSFVQSCTYKTVYKFQGYLVYQVRTPNIPSDFYDPTQAQLVAEFDIANDNIKQLINQYRDPTLGVYIPKLMVSGTDNGIKHSFVINTDYFQTGVDQSLVNFTTYNYIVLAYANYANCTAEKTQFLASVKTINMNALAIYSATPHDPSPRGTGTQVNSNFGDGIPLTQVEGIGNGGNTIMLTQDCINEAISSGTGYVAKPRNYMQNASPVYVKVVNPLLVPLHDFAMFMRDTSNSNVKGDSLSSFKTIWYIKDLTTNEVVQCNQTINNSNEQIIPQWGLSISVSQCIRPGEGTIYDASGNATDLDVTNGFLSSTLNFNNNNIAPWLIGVTDEGSYPPYGSNISNQLNWIRSGQAGKPAYTDPKTSDFAIGGRPLDPDKGFSKIINSTWSPYALATRLRPPKPSRPLVLTNLSYGPAYDNSSGFASIDNPLYELSNVQIVFTSDKTKWSRCIVLETGEDWLQNKGGADKLDIRTSKSVDKNGKSVDQGALSDPSNPDAADYISSTGMSWFPGYAVNFDTGERLNLIFGEDSSDPNDNGDDMIWNPTGSIYTFNGGQVVPTFGGKHFIYVMGNNKFSLSNGSIKYTPTRYDECRNYISLLSSDPSRSVNDKILSMSVDYNTRKRIFFSQPIYTSIPTTAPNQMLTMKDGLIPNDATITINVKKAYAARYTSDIKDSANNSGMPYFTFSTKNYAAVANTSFGKKALDLVNIVPNPYYAFSPYEDQGNPLDTRIRITNLPQRCEIDIYTLDGVLVRRISRDDNSKTYFEWDIKNDAKVPIVSGIYLIHIKATDLSEERVIKWFAVMRPANYDSF